MNIPSVHYADDEEIDDYDEEEDLDVTSDLDPSPEDEVDPLTCSPDVGELKSTGVGDRKKVSLQLRFEGRQSLSMSHREWKIVPDGKTSERKGALSLKPFTSVRNTEDASVSRGAESV